MGKKKDGLQAFEEFYSETYAKRWPNLKEALLGPKNHLVLYNPYYHQSMPKRDSFLELPFLYENEGETLEGNQEERPLPYYFLDGASAIAPHQLEVKPGEKVLDLCAAPGGKSLILAYALAGQGSLTANDKSENRRFRLQRVLRDYLPADVYDNSIRITGFDAGGWCLYEKEAYDKILLDAPCSSERHLLESPHLLKEWRVGRTKRLAKNQWTMLASAWLVLKYGGRLVYSTCSLSPLENDGVVEKLIKKFGKECEVIKPEIPGAEETSYGRLLLPDRSGHGPFYLSVLEKKS
jgi:16S rRNA C967 or C1407 C5-methylase (RsmB/RsmF family)